MLSRSNYVVIALIFLLHCTFIAHSQNTNGTIQGKFIGKSGMGLNDTRLAVLPAGDTAITNADGIFSIKAKTGDSILATNTIIPFEIKFVLPAHDSILVELKENNDLAFGKWNTSSGGLHDSVSSPSVIANNNKPKTADSVQASDSGHIAATAVPGDTTTVHGKVVNDSNQPLESVSIETPDGKLYVSAKDGSFSFPFIKGQKVKFSSVGVTDKEVVITDASQPLLVTLLAKKSSEELEQVTVTALGISKKGRAVGYAVQEIKGDAVQTAKETNFVNALQGKLAGVQINGNTGSMGGSAKVTIRGNKSITGNNNALFVVDGIFMGNTNSAASYNQQIGGGGYDYGSPIQDINPDDIDQISVLKGAAATALYGSRGGNGVVVITTKKANKGTFGINYSLNAQMDKVYILPSFQNQYGGGSVSPTSSKAMGDFNRLIDTGINKQYFLNAPTYRDEANNWGYDLMPNYSVDESWGPKLDGTIYRPYYSFDKNKNNPYFGVTSAWNPQPDNVKNFYRTGITLTNSLSLGGQNDKGGFRVSYSNLTQKFILPNSNMYRNNIGFSGNYKVMDAVTAVVGANYSENRAVGRPGTGFSGTNPTQLFTLYGQRQLEIDKLKYYEFPDGSQVSWNRKSYNDPQPASATTPYWTAYKGYESDNRKRIYGTAGFEIKPADWINISAKAYIDQYNTLIEERSPKDYQAGGYTRTDLTHRELNYLLMATAKKSLGKIVDLTVTGGGNIMQQRDEMNTAVANGLITPGLYTLTNSSSVVKPTRTDLRKQINSLFGDVTLGYDNTVFIDITGRNDWASSLYPKNPSFFYPSASLSAIFSDWLKWKWLSFGKFRTSIARIGYDTDPYRTIQAYALSNIFNGLSISSKDLTIANPGLKPEMSTELEAGLELKFLNNRVGIDATVYTRKTKDLIIPLSITQTSGYNSYYANVGTSQTKGLELTLSGTPIDNKNFKWDAAFNFSMNRSKLLSVNIPNNPNSKQPVIIGTDRRSGNPVSVAAVVGQPLYVLIGTDYTYLNGQKVVDTSRNSFNYVANRGQIIGNTQPDFVGGFSNSFTYKKISLSALLDFQKGGDFYSYTNTYGLASGTLAETAVNNIRENGVDASGVLANGTPVSKNVRADLYFKNTNNGRIINAATVYDASYIYLREVKLGYALPEKWASKIRAANATVSLYGRNLWLIHSNAPNVDPSNLLNSDSNIMGLEGGALPSLRSFGVNVSLGF